MKWSDIEYVCPTPFKAPSERTEAEARLWREMKLEPSTLSLHVRLRAPEEFWKRAGHARGPATIDIDLVPLDTLPVPLEELYAFLRARARFELVAFDWAD